MGSGARDPSPSTGIRFQFERNRQVAVLWRFRADPDPDPDLKRGSADPAFRPGGSGNIGKFPKKFSWNITGGGSEDVSFELECLSQIQC